MQNQDKTNILQASWSQLKAKYPFLHTFQTFFQAFTESQTPQLYPLQKKALPQICGHNNNLICRSPTSSGKTLFFYMSILQYINKFIIDKNKNYLQRFKVIYIAPTKAVCQQKIKQLKKMGQIIKQYNFIDIRSEYISSERKYEQKQSDTENILNESNIIVCTPQMCVNIFKHYSQFIENLCMFLVDQIHLITCEKRGQHLQMIINKILNIKSLKGFQNLRMIGATASVPNIQDILDWTKSKQVIHNQRPVKIQLIEPVFKKKLHNIPQKKYFYTSQTNSGQRQKCMRSNMHKIIGQFQEKFQKQVNRSKKSQNYLIFCPSKILTENAANSLCKSIEQKKLVFKRDYTQNSITWDKIKQNLDKQIHQEQLKKCIKNRVGFHHASLQPDEKQYVLKLMKQGWLIVIFCTTTLSQGVNLPVKAVIIMDVVRYGGKRQQNLNQSENQNEYKSSEIDQMIGRAGRSKHDKIAYCAILGNQKHTQKYLKCLREGRNLDLQPIQSTLMDKFQQFLIFSLFSNGYQLNNNSEEKIIQQFSNSLWAIKNKKQFNIKNLLKEKLALTKQQFNQYKLDTKMLYKICELSITYKSYRKIYKKLTNWHKRYANFYEQEQQFLKMACQVDEITISHRYDRNYDQKGHFNKQIKVPYQWKVKKSQNESQQTKIDDIKKAVFLVQVLLIGKAQKLKQNYQLYQDCYEVALIFKQVCKLIKSLIFKNNLQTVGVLFWCMIYLKYCDPISNRQQSMYQKMEKWYSHMNIQKCWAKLLQINGKVDGQQILESQRNNKNIQKWGFFSIRSSLLDNNMASIQIKNMLKEYQITIKIIGQKYLIKARNQNKQVQLYAFYEESNKYKFSQCQQSKLFIQMKQKNFIIIAIFPQQRGMDRIYIHKPSEMATIKQLQLKNTQQPKQTKEKESRSLTEPKATKKRQS